MKALQFTETKELALDGWNIDQVEPAIFQALRSFSGDRFKAIETRRDTYQDRMARQLWIDTFSDDEADKKPGGYREAGGYRVPIMMFEHWQIGPQLRITARCYYEESQPLFEHILSELGAPPDGGQVPKGRKKGMTEERKKRALTFKSIKDKNPDMTLPQVAEYANTNHPNIVASGDMVKNDYRDMGWECLRVYPKHMRRVATRLHPALIGAIVIRPARI